MFVVKMGTIFRLCAILIVFEKCAESKAGYRSVIEQRKCVRYIEATLKDKNIVTKNGDTSKNEVRFECDNGLKSNVPKLQDIWFKCEWHSTLGEVAWKGQGVGVETDQGGSPLYLQNITCLSACPKPVFPDNMVLKVNSTTKLKVLNRDAIPFEDNPFFLVGDIITLDCEDGYVHEGTAEREYETKQDDSNSYENYGIDEVTEIVPTKSLQCGADGMLNHGSNAYGTCREITCDATSYQTIKNGLITNYKNVYQFQEVLKLQCDEGFRPNDNRDYMQCLTDNSFKNQNFNCEPITCLTPPEPFHGRLETTQFYYYPNETAEFACDYGYTMVGSPIWECQPSGEWNNLCVQCVREDDYCQPPCVPVGARIVDIPRRIEIGTTIEFGCNDKVYGGSTNRTCLFNKQWSNEPIDCTGWSLFTSNTGIYLKEALQQSLVKADIRANKSRDTSEEDKDTAKGRTINVKSTYGVDAYILIDVSKSMDDNQLNTMKKFVVALVENLGVSDDEDGTRVAVYLFASSMKALFIQDDYKQHTKDDIIDTINKIDRNEASKFQKETGFGTAISSALDDVRIDIETKRRKARARNAQQVVILVSDGKYTQRGTPVPFAKHLKDRLEVEFYSIFLGKNEDASAYNVMQEMASKIGTEKHFFAIDINKNMTDIINEMITKQPVMPCGGINPILTSTKDVNQSRYVLAQKSAWPWMVQLRTASYVACGGTLISNQWILTAAHCFNESDKADKSSQLNQIKTVELKTWKTDATDEGKMSFPITYASPTTNAEKNGDVFIHTKYNNPVTGKRNFTYDIALIQLRNNVLLDRDVNPVCLWNPTNKTDDIKDFSYSSLFKQETFGVVTGWGYKNKQEEREAYMKQMQFPIQDFKTCINHITKAEEKEKPHMSEEFMFCAGTTGTDDIIDACTGDSGGPFVVPYPRKENQYIQIGIVSFGIGNKCREHPYRGYYTKLNEELLEWINNIVNTHSRS